jgi:hypothetical protein
MAWTLYGILGSDIAVTAANSVTFLLVLTLVVTKFTTSPPDP